MSLFDIIDNVEFNRNTPIVNGEQFLPSVYMFSLGTVKELRESLSIPAEYKDDSVVAKYGYTKDFTFMTKKLQERYVSIEKLNLQLLHHQHIDQRNIFKAEEDIRKNIELLHYKQYELGEFIIIPNFMMNLIKKKYEQISEKYNGKNKYLMDIILGLERGLERTTQIYEWKLNQQKMDTEIEVELQKRYSTILEIKMMMMMEEGITDKTKN